jgi:hypothetical protein
MLCGAALLHSTQHRLWTLQLPPELRLCWRHLLMLLRVVSGYLLLADMAVVTAAVMPPCSLLLSREKDDSIKAPASLA